MHVYVTQAYLISYLCVLETLWMGNEWRRVDSSCYRIGKMSKHHKWWWLKHESCTVPFLRVWYCMYCQGQQWVRMVNYFIFPYWEQSWNIMSIACLHPMHKNHVTQLCKYDSSLLCVLSILAGNQCMWKVSTLEMGSNADGGSFWWRDGKVGTIVTYLTSAWNCTNLENGCSNLFWCCYHILSTVAVDS